MIMNRKDSKMEPVVPNGLVCDAFQAKPVGDNGLHLCARLRTVLFAIGLAGPILAFAATSPDKLVWLDAPAAAFIEASPLGNGRLGVTVFGGVAEELLVLNESGMWSGGPQDA